MFGGLLLLLVGLHLAEAAGEGLQVGAATQEITPKEPLPLWGYALRKGLSDGVLDPLYADALVIQAGENKIAIVSLDLGRCPTDRSLANIRRRLKAHTGIENLMVAASHTHHGPVLEFSAEEGKGKGRFDAALRYYSQLEDAIVTVVTEANRRLAPSTLACGSVKLQKFNFNRLTSLYPPPLDPELAVMRFDTPSGAPAAILINFAAHPTLVPKEDMRFSADYVGVLKKTVREKMGGNVLFIQGAAGDLDADQSDDYRAYGSRLAGEVIQLASKLKPEAVAAAELQIKEKRFQFQSRLDLDDRRTRRECERLFGPELVANYRDQYALGITPKITVAVLNRHIAMVAMPREFFSSFSTRLKQQASENPVFFFGYCNGYWQYFPTQEAIAGGGYGTEPMSAPSPVGAGETMMLIAAKFIQQLEGQAMHAGR